MKEDSSTATLGKIKMNAQTMPEYVGPIRELIFRTFGNPPIISGFEYRAIINILHPYFSDRGLAEVLKWTFGKDYNEALHDVYSVGEDGFNVPQEELDSTYAKLRSNGFEDWLKKHPPLT